MNSVRFTKIEATGNDFIVINGFEYSDRINSILETVPKICNRRFGIGADGVLILSPPQISDALYEMVYKNADGSDAGMCGNGARALVLYASTLDMGYKFLFHNKEITYRALIKENTIEVSFPHTITIEVLDHINDSYYCYPGTEHVVTLKKFQNEDYQTSFAKRIRYDSSHFPKGTNVNFLSIESNQLLNVKTYERGVEDFTLACGTGSIASALTAATLNAEMTSPIRVMVQGGYLDITFEKNAHNQFTNITLKGEASISFKGEFLIENYI